MRRKSCPQCGESPQEAGTPACCPPPWLPPFLGRVRVPVKPPLQAVALLTVAHPSLRSPGLWLCPAPPGTAGAQEPLCTTATTQPHPAASEDPGEDAGPSRADRYPPLVTGGCVRRGGDGGRQPLAWRENEDSTSRDVGVGETEGCLRVFASLHPAGPCVCFLPVFSGFIFVIH